MWKRKIAGLLLCCLLLSVLVGCAKDSGTLMELDGCTLSVNAYELLLTRMKGKLVYTYKVNATTDSFWSTIMNTDGTTYNDFYTLSVLNESYKYVEAEYMFRKAGLTLPDSEVEKVDARLAELVEDAGSKTILNGKLAELGVNYNQLREHYLLEARIKYLQTYLYGEKGEKIDRAVKDDYYDRNYISFRQIFLASYDYVFVTDTNGDRVYYKENGEIAYDSVNGTKKTDEFGFSVLDDKGNVIYYDENGKIAYDKEHGEPRCKTDKDGTPVVEAKTGEALEDLKKRAAEIAEDAAGLDETAFAALADQVSESESNTRVYLRREKGYYASQSAAYLDNIAAAVYENEVGGVCTVQSDSGYHILLRCEPEPQAYDSEDQNTASAFTDFYSLLIGSLFTEACDAYKDMVTINESVYKKAPSIREVSYENTKY